MDQGTRSGAVQVLTAPGDAGSRDLATGEVLTGGPGGPQSLLAVPATLIPDLVAGEQLDAFAFSSPSGTEIYLFRRPAPPPP
jgi:hypothetical protein